MGTLKITSWNVAHLARLLATDLNSNEKKRRDGIVREILDLSPDILCLLEAPKGFGAVSKFASKFLQGEYVPVKSPDDKYDTQGDQWIWFFVRKRWRAAATLQPTAIWDRFAGPSWTVHYWGVPAAETHRHYRHPQVLVFNWPGLRVEFIGLHLKSKFINGGQSMWNAGGAQRDQFVQEALKARIKLATEAANVRRYLDAKFAQVEKPALFVLGDLNDGPGKEHFEEQYLFFDLVGNLQGEVFFAQRFLNHALFDYPQPLRWSVTFRDFVEPTRDPKILLDHILFTQGLVDGSLPWQVRPKSGFVEHEVHDLVNATLTSAQETSDHKPVSLLVTVND
jgi:hypothetical protein